MATASIPVSDLPTRLLAARRARQLTQAEAADLFEISLRHYQRWESGTCAPRRRELARIDAHFDSPRRDLAAEIDAIQDELQHLRKEISGLRGVPRKLAASGRR